MNEATVNLFYDERRGKKGNKKPFGKEISEKIYPVKLTVYHPLFDKKRYKTGIDLTPEEWEKINAPKLKDQDLKDTKLKLDAFVYQASEVIKKLDSFSFEAFEDEFFGAIKKRKKDSFFETFQEYIKKLKANGEHDLAVKFGESLALLKRFRVNLLLNQITPRFLEEFEAFIKREVEASDKLIEKIIRLHSRNLKAVIVDLISKGILHQDKCPFNLVFELFDTYREDLYAEDRVGSASLFRYTHNMLKEWRSDLKLSAINDVFVKEYHNYMREKKLSDTAIGINLRNLRTIVNVAIKKKLFSYEDYPFKGYNIPNGQNVKKAFSDDALSKILNYVPKDPDQQEALDYWVFIYLCNGLQMKDVALLLKANVDHDFFYFRRAKTIRTRKKDQQPIKVALHKRAKEIIERRKSDDSNPYLFPILSPGVSAITIRGRVTKKLKFVNQHMKQIVADLKIELGPFRQTGTMAARHSFATKLRRKGVPDNEIGEYLGHTDPKTTKNYFDSFPDEHLKKRSELLL